MSLRHSSDDGIMCLRVEWQELFDVSIQAVTHIGVVLHDTPQCGDHFDQTEHSQTQTT